MKKTSFFLIWLLLSILFVELSGQMLYRVLKGKFMWKDYNQYDLSVFNIRPFTEFVEDDRLVTNKKNFSTKIYGWEVKTDAYGFRVGTNEYSKKNFNIIFLGDSVPFGWGGSGEQNVPSKFYNLIKDKYSTKYGVINAAIPSYSLYQAIMRYRYEIYGKFPVKYVILQIYDPATQFVIWGKNWNEKICFTSKNTLLFFKDIANSRCRLQYFLCRYSFIYRSISTVLMKVDLEQKQISMQCSMSPLDITDKRSFDYFEERNIFILEEFHALLKKNNISLIILPVNPTKPFQSYRRDEIEKLDPDMKSELIAVNKLNEILYKFASSHKGVYYFDIIGYFENIGRDGMFVDSCCHLSEKGAQKQAEFILEQLQANNLL
jgi:hypothetical protein